MSNSPFRMSNPAERFSPASRFFGRRFALLFLLLWLHPLQAQNAFLHPVSALDNRQAPPTYAQLSQAIAIDTAQIDGAQLGNRLSLQISATRQIHLEVRKLDRYVNGDQVVVANGRDGDRFFSLTLTRGERNLFGHLSSNDETYQIAAIANGLSAHYQGWIYMPGSLLGAGQSFQNDYFIVSDRDSAEALAKPAPKIISVLPLQIDGTSSNSATQPDNAAASTSGISASNFRISQNFSSTSVLVGNAVELSVAFENTSSQIHNSLYVEFYFILEESALLAAPAECREQLSLSLQQTLYCDLGDFQPGEKKSFDISIKPDASAKPRVLSSVVMGDLRVDGFVNVVEDVRVDSDGDGISDFNELLLATDAQDAGSVDKSNSVIDVLALYTPGAAALYPYGVQTRINQLISVANQIYVDSGVQITLRPVYHGRVNYSDSVDMDRALNDLMENSDAAFGEVESLREIYGADLVMLFRPSQPQEGRCGLAPVGGFGTNGDFTSALEKTMAYSHIAVDCPADLVAAHEIGHNMGLTHSHLEDGSGGTFDFSTGYGVEGQFVTVMAYPAAFNTQTRVSVFSNPLADCLGFSCGLAAEREFGADAVQSLNLVRHQIADYFPTKVPDLPNTNISTLSGEVSSANIAIAASRDGGLSFASSVSFSDSVSLEAKVRIDERHVGLYGGIYVLIGLEGQGLFQLNDLGTLVEWDGTAAGLIPFSGNRKLRSSEHLTIMDGFQFGSAFSNQQLTVYVAYWVESEDEVVYTRDPFLLSIQ